MILIDTDHATFLMYPESERDVVDQAIRVKKDSKARRNVVKGHGSPTVLRPDH